MIYPPTVSKETLALIADALAIHIYSYLVPSKKTYVYRISDPRPEGISAFYIGCTQDADSSIDASVPMGTNKLLRDRVAELRNNNIEPVYDIICICSSLHKAIIEETSWMKHYTESGHDIIG